MADSPRKTPAVGSVDDEPAPEPTPRRKPPKLKRPKPSPETAPESSEKPLAEDVARHGSDNEAMSNDQNPQGEDKRTSETETLATEESSLPEPQEMKPKRTLARRTIVRERAKDAPPEIWRRTQRADQQGAQLGDVGNTVNEAGDLVRNVGTTAVQTVGETVGRALNTVTGGERREQGEKQDQLRLRLDLNLDLEIQLKAKIHGDLTLQLLN